MTSKVIWFDRSNRRKFLQEAFKDGDWIGLPGITISGATHVLVHHTDFKNSRTERLTEFKEAIQALMNCGHRPLIFVYSGDPIFVVKEEMERQSVHFFTELSLNCIPLYQIYQNKDSVTELSRVLASEKQETVNDIRTKYKNDKDTVCAIELVAEVVAWINLTQSASPLALEEIRSRLIGEFGGGGEILKNALVAKLTDDVRDRINAEVERTKAQRVDAWKKAGMLKAN